MAFDLILRDATLPDGRTGIDLGIAGGRIAAVAPGLPGDGCPEYPC